MSSFLTTGAVVSHASQSGRFSSVKYSASTNKSRQLSSEICFYFRFVALWAIMLTSPGVFSTLIVQSEMSSRYGMGSERYIRGSNLVEVTKQFLHVSVDRS
jgi:hypothetical protein